MGAEHGIETPYNSAVVRMVKAKESLVVQAQADHM